MARRRYTDSEILAAGSRLSVCTIRDSCIVGGLVSTYLDWDGFLPYEARLRAEALLNETTCETRAIDPNDVINVHRAFGLMLATTRAERRQATSSAFGGSPDEAAS